MRIEYKSRIGNFNFFDPDEESISCNIAIYDNDGERGIGVKITDLIK
jgi:hypothetical protein